jgi:hypothetical protein
MPVQGSCIKTTIRVKKPGRIGSGITIDRCEARELDGGPQAHFGAETMGMRSITALSIVVCILSSVLSILFYIERKFCLI